MKSLAKPLQGKKACDIFSECVNDYSSESYRTRMRQLLNDVKVCSENYSKNIPYNVEEFKNQITKFDHHNLQEDDKDNLKKVYTDKFSKDGTVGRKYYNFIISQARGICPICGTGTVANLDHYLPQSVYPLLVVTPLNLIPSCRDCNMSKGAYNPSESAKLPLHPYFDKIEYKWLEVHMEFIDDGSFRMVYYNGLDELSDPIMKSRLDTHIEVNHLQNTFTSRALTELNSVKNFYKKMLSYGVVEGFKSNLKETCESAEEDDLNSWKSALYRALLRQFEDFKEWLELDQALNSGLKSENINLPYNTNSLYNVTKPHKQAFETADREKSSSSTSENVTNDDMNVNKQLFEAQHLYLAKDYNATKVIYQNVFEQSSRAKLNLGYLYAHGYGVHQDTIEASKLYKAAYEDGNSLGLQNYISINLTMPSSYEDTLKALKYGYEHNNKTAISYLSICFCGELRDVSDEELKKMANTFIVLEHDEQIKKLSAQKDCYLTEVIYYEKNEKLVNTEFIKYILCEDEIQYIVRKEVERYITIPSEISEDEERIVPVYATGEKIPYMKITYHFYMSEYFELDKFDSI